MDVESTDDDDLFSHDDDLFSHDDDLFSPDPEPSNDYDQFTADYDPDMIGDQYNLTMIDGEDMDNYYNQSINPHEAFPEPGRKDLENDEIQSILFC